MPAKGPRPRGCAIGPRGQSWIRPFHRVFGASGVPAGPGPEAAAAPLPCCGCIGGVRVAAASRGATCQTAPAGVNPGDIIRLLAGVAYCFFCARASRDEVQTLTLYSVPGEGRVSRRSYRPPPRPTATSLSGGDAKPL